LTSAGLLVWVIAFRQPRPRRLAWSGLAVLAAWVAAGLIYLSLPKTQVRLVARPFRTMDWEIRSVVDYLNYTNQLTLAQARAAIRDDFLPNMTNQFSHEPWENYALGGPIREEDSPGNYGFLETTDTLRVVAYDADGGEHLVDH
jgi:hypothetical protein